MLLKDAKTVLRQLASQETGARLDVDDADGLILKLPLVADSANETALTYIVRRGKGNASIFVWAYVAIWATESFAEPGFETEPAFLDELPAKHRPGIIRLRRQSVHEYAFLSPTGDFLADLIQFRPEAQAITWTSDELRADFAATCARCRELVTTLPSQETLASLLSQRQQARARLLRSEA